MFRAQTGAALLCARQAGSSGRPWSLLRDRDDGSVQRLLPRLLLHVQRYHKTIIINGKQNTKTHMTFGVKQPVIDDTSGDLWSGVTYRCDSGKGELFLFSFFFSSYKQNEII